MENWHPIECRQAGTRDNSRLNKRLYACNEGQSACGSRRVIFSIAITKPISIIRGRAVISTPDCVTSSDRGNRRIPSFPLRL